jgi:hypothetical protein
MEGVNGLIVAVDVNGIGHYTTYPSDKETIALQIPFKNGVAPRHEVLRKGACHSNMQTTADEDLRGVVQKLLLRSSDEDQLVRMRVL